MTVIVGVFFALISDLTKVAYGVAQPTKEGQTVRSMPVTSGHISVTVQTIVKGFEDFSLLGSNGRMEP